MRTLELRLGNGGWTFLSEIEMAAEQKASGPAGVLQALREGPLCERCKGVA